MCLKSFRKKISTFVKKYKLYIEPTYCHIVNFRFYLLRNYSSMFFYATKFSSDLFYEFTPSFMNSIIVIYDRYLFLQEQTYLRCKRSLVIKTFCEAIRLL